MSRKIVFIGGGSYSWIPTLVGDLFNRRSLAGSELNLVDINPEAVNHIKEYCELLSQKMDVKWKIKVVDLEEALDDADVVNLSINTGGLEMMHVDYTVPEEFGIYHSVGDTVGPAGIFRSLRSIPVFVGIARKMEKLCPRARIIHVTNPLSQLTRAVSKASSIKCIGLCHNFTGMLHFLAAYFGVAYKDVDAICVGVNHFTWLKNITVKGKSAENRLSLKRYIDFQAERNEIVKTNTTDDEIEEMLGEAKLPFYINFELFERFGYFPVGGSSHQAENYPFYLNNLETIKKHHIKRKGVLPVRAEGKEKAKQKILDIITGKEELKIPDLSCEGFSEIVESLMQGKPTRSVVAMPNQGQVSNLPNEIVVETWAMISGNGIFPVISGPIPSPLTGFMQSVVDEQECTVEAGLTGNWKKVLQALAVSSMVQNKDCVETLADKLYTKQKQYLPQFNK